MFQLQFAPACEVVSRECVGKHSNGAARKTARQRGEGGREGGVCATLFGFQVKVLLLLPVATLKEMCVLNDYEWTARGLRAWPVTVGELEHLRYFIKYCTHCRLYLSFSLSHTQSAPHLSFSFWHCLFVCHSILTFHLNYFSSWQKNS